MCAFQVRSENELLLPFVDTYALDATQLIKKIDVIDNFPYKMF